MTQGAFRLFSFRGITVFLHWSWLAVGLLELQWRSDAYSSVVWNAVEYVGLFGLVLLHEFGHALACRSTGGQAERIMLWPLGGVAYVRPPPRPGAHLWSIAAGPLVNLVLAPLLIGAVLLLPAEVWPNLHSTLLSLAYINAALFVFNMLPIYPLDGGQILRSVLWFVIGRERSLRVAATIGLVASVIGGLAAVVWLKSMWTGLIAAYAAWQSWRGLQVAKARTALLTGPRQPHARCPVCGEAPPAGPLWRCSHGHAFDLYRQRGTCPECGEHLSHSSCVFCGEVSALEDFTETEARP